MEVFGSFFPQLHVVAPTHGMALTWVKLPC